VNDGNLRISAAGGGGLYDNGYQWLECDNDASWYRLARTAKTSGIACYNGIAINDQGGLVVGSWDNPNTLGVGNGKFTGTVTATTFTGSLSQSVTPGSYLTGDAYDGSTATTFAVDATVAATGLSKIVARDASGHIFANNLNMSHSASARNSDTVFYSSTDDYIRKTTAAGMRSSLGVAALAGSTTQAFSAERVGMGATASASYKLYVKHDDTTADGGTTAAYIKANYSGSDTLTGNKTNRGLFIEVDSSATGGTITNGHEHRLYGVYSDVRHTGDSDLCYAGYFYARSDHTAGQCSALKGIYVGATDSANGTNSAVYAGEFKALKDTGSTNTTATMMGIRAEVEIDAGTITNAYGVHSHIDRDGGTITNGYLFHGSYGGTDTGVKWGIHLSGVEKNYLTGTLQVVGTVTAPTFSGNATTASSAATLTTARNINGVSFNGSANITVNGSNYNVNNGWLRYISDASHVKLYGNQRTMVFRTDNTLQYGSTGAYPFIWLYGGDASGNRLMIMNTSGQLWLSNYGWLHDKFALRAGDSGVNFSANRSYAYDWFRAMGNNGIYFQDHGGGLHMQDSEWVRVYNNKKLYSQNEINTASRMYASGYVNIIMTARYYNSSGNSGGYTGTRAISVYAEHHMRCSEMQVTSDRRIKTDIVDVDDISALTLLRKIQPRTYGYVDKVHNGEGRVYGFIAQEIKELIPDAVDVSEGDLPNIYKHATINIQANSITIKDFDTSTLNQTDSIIYIDQDDQRKTLKIKSIINSTQLEIEEDLEKIVETLKTSELEEHNFTGEIFIWGQKVQDFHHLKKSAIYTVATAALQEVDRQLQAEKIRTYELQQKVELLEMSHGALIQRVEALEKL
jgi:hypothetical protein